jgi:hypothetical protein
MPIRGDKRVLQTDFGKVGEVAIIKQNNVRSRPRFQHIAQDALQSVGIRRRFHL